MNNKLNREKLIEELMLLERRITRTAGQYNPEVWMDLGLELTISQLKSLMFIDFEGSTNSRKLASALGVTPPNVTGIIDRLVEKKLVSRTENPEDRRIATLALTSRGKAVLTKLQETKRSLRESILKRLTLEELSCLLYGLSAIAREFEAEQKENGVVYKG
jgi:DNA-binding MarR family transcriptional regulator